MPDLATPADFENSLDFRIGKWYYVSKYHHNNHKKHIMIENANNKWAAMSDRAIAGEIGTYIKEKRLSLNQTQAQIAAKAGISRWTLSQLENGEPGTVLSLIQVLRAMDLLHILDIFKIEQVIRPIELAKMERRKRQRARGKDKGKQPESDW